MEMQLRIIEKYLCLPVKTEKKEKQKLKKLEIFHDGNKVFEFHIPFSDGKDDLSFDYLAYTNVEQYRGEELLLKGELPSAFFNQISQDADCRREPQERPQIHFTADRGWINDPNGLVYHDGVYHLYFQYNPFNTEWENMSWGSAVSMDLIHWQQLDTVLWPDEKGTIYSGSGIVNEQSCLGLPDSALIYYYTAAGSTNDWSKGLDFTQRIAYSLDNGTSLIKYPKPALESIYTDSRDPKVFWHEASKAYIMVLWLRGHEFGIFRSEDMLSWQNIQTLELPDAWECPDLVELDVDDGTKQWIFWCADGYYYPGDFDGYRFNRTGEKKAAYGTKLPYAAQTYSGIEGRVITVAWLRTIHQGKLYTGAMAIPREMTMTCKAGVKKLQLRTVKELEKCKKPIMLTKPCCYNYTEDVPFELKLTWSENPGNMTRVKLLDQTLLVEPADGIIRFEGQRYEADQPISQMTVIADRGVIEITVNDDIIYLTYESSVYRLAGGIEAEGDGIYSFELNSIY